MRLAARNFQILRNNRFIISTFSAFKAQQLMDGNHSVDLNAKMWDLGQLAPYFHLHPELTHRYSPLQAKDAVEERVLRRTAMQDEDTAQHVEVEVILMQIAQQPGLEERGPSFLER